MTAAPHPALQAPSPDVPEAIAPERLDADAVKVIQRLGQHGYTAYLVGGGVRDLLLGRRPKDFDIATDARPVELKRLFRNCRIIGRRFRLAHMLFGGGKVIEVATFRRDPGNEGSSEEDDLLIRDDNLFGTPEEDARRRDFTVNGLFYDIERGEVIDSVGGLADLRRRTVRTIGDARVRLREDPVRMLRAIKFCARLDLGIDAQLLDAMCSLREELQRAAPARVFEELLRLLRGGAALRSFYLAWETGLLGVMLPELAAYLDDVPEGAEHTWARLAAVDQSVAKGLALADDVLFAALVLGPLEEGMQHALDPLDAYEHWMQEVTAHLLVPRKMKERLKLLVWAQRPLRAGRSDRLAKRDFFVDACQLHRLDCQARGVPMAGKLRAQLKTPGVKSQALRLEDSRRRSA